MEEMCAMWMNKKVDFNKIWSENDESGQQSTGGREECIVQD